MRKIVILGAGGFGREVKFILDRINNVKQTFELLGFYDDNTNASEVIHGQPVLGTLEDLLKVNDDIDVVIGIGVPAIKMNVYNKLKGKCNFGFPNIIDPSAVIGKDEVVLGKGSIICSGVIITCDVKLNDFITLNLSCTVGHDTELDSFASFMPSVNISGEVKIRKGVYVGTGAKIINSLEIGENTIIGAGAVVAKSLPSDCTAVGIPAKPIKFHNE